MATKSASSLLRKSPPRPHIRSNLSSTIYVGPQNHDRQAFSSSPAAPSRIGLTPIPLPPDVSLTFVPLPRTASRSRAVDAPTQLLTITGPLGTQTLPLPPYVFPNHDQSNGKLSLTVGDQSIKHQKSMWGTYRALLQNSITGVSEGHICILRLVGVGYRATIENNAVTKESEYEGQKFVSLKLGYAHPVELPVPKGVKASTPQPTRILLEGSDKQVVKQFAAKIRMWRKPEPYKGKGIFVDGETIKLKAKKIK